MSEVIRANKVLGVFLIRAGDGQYEVIADGKAAELTPTTVLALAEAVYREQCEHRSAPARERLMRESAYRDASAVRLDSAGQRAAASRRGGGRGGRGGV